MQLVPAPPPDDLVEAGHDGIGVDGVRHQVGERLPGELVDDVEDLEDLPSDRDVELEVERPHVVGVFGDEPVRRHGRLAHPGPLALLLGHPQALFPPQALDLLAVDAVTLGNEDGVRLAVAAAGVARGEAAHPGPDSRIGIWRQRVMALGGAVLADDLTRPPLREAEPDLEHLYGSASPRRAHQLRLRDSLG